MHDLNERLRGSTELRRQAYATRPPKPTRSSMGLSRKWVEQNTVFLPQRMRGNALLAQRLFVNLFSRLFHSRL